MTSLAGQYANEVFKPSLETTFSLRTSKINFGVVCFVVLCASALVVSLMFPEIFTPEP